eukprot:553491-Hanusia_phi.AAC.2
MHNLKVPLAELSKDPVGRERRAGSRPTCAAVSSSVYHRPDESSPPSMPLLAVPPATGSKKLIPRPSSVAPLPRVLNPRTSSCPGTGSGGCQDQTRSVQHQWCPVQTQDLRRGYEVRQTCYSKPHRKAFPREGRVDRAPGQPGIRSAMHTCINLCQHRIAESSVLLRREGEENVPARPSSQMGPAQPSALACVAECTAVPGPRTP